MTTVEQSDLEATDFYRYLPSISRKHILNSLIQSRYNNLEKLCMATENDLLLVKGIGESIVEIIQRVLDDLGMHLAKSTSILDVSSIENSEFCDYLPDGQRRRILKVLIEIGYDSLEKLCAKTEAELETSLHKSKYGIPKQVIQHVKDALDTLGLQLAVPPVYVPFGLELKTSGFYINLPSNSRNGIVGILIYHRIGSLKDLCLKTEGELFLFLSMKSIRCIKDALAKLDLQLTKTNWDVQDLIVVTFMLADLDERSVDIISSRLLADKSTTLRELAQRHGVTPARIGQIETKTMRKFWGYWYALIRCREDTLHPLLIKAKIYQELLFSISK